ncbi:MAG: glycosyltransferase [Candidatus Methanomethylicaceae archaeon]
MISIEDYAPIVGKGEVESIKELAKHVEGAKVLHVNATKFGGGVAEILSRVVPLARSVGLNAEWEVIQGDRDFFWVTKKIHNALQGDETVSLDGDKIRIYLETNRRNAFIIPNDAEVVVIHDPQPLPLIENRRSGKWVWRCHIDTSNPNMGVWSRLRDYIRMYDAAIFSLERYIPKDLAGMKVLIDYPTIDPLAAKNMPLTPTEIQKVLERYDIDPERPIVGQVARFDPWKNPTGVVDVYRKVKKNVEGLQLLMIGSFAHDDAEGEEWYNKTVKYSGGDKDIHILTNLDGVMDKEVNAFQRSFNAALQLSIREGFGLTVAEALWKGVPVVGTKAGGITLQVIDGVTGYLVNSIEDAAERVKLLLRRPWLARELGYAGRQHVKLNFLITKGLKNYLRMHIDLVGK